MKKCIKPSEIPVFGSKPTAKTASAGGKNKLTLQQRIEIINGIENQKITRKEVLSRYEIHKSSLGLMLKPEIKRKYKEKFNLGINLETKRTKR